MVQCPTCGETESLSSYGEGEYNCNECNTQFNEDDDFFSATEDISSDDN